MRGNIRKWMVVGALASAALLFPGCRKSERGTEQGGMQQQTGTGGTGGTGMGEQGTGGGGTTGGARQGTRGTTMTTDAGTPTMDAGTGGAGFEERDMGTRGEGATGGSSDVGSETGGSRDINR